MKILQVLIVVLLGGTGLLTAQDAHLPVSSKSAEAKAAFAQGMAYGEEAQIPEYFAQMEKVRALDENFFFAYAYPSLYHRAFGNNEMADEMRDKALAIKSKKFTPAEQAVRKMFQTAKADPTAKMGPIVAELVAAYPDNPHAYEMAMMTSYMFDQDHAQALKYGKKLAELRPDYPGTHNMLGYIYMSQGDMAQAKAHFDKYLAMAPQTANAYDSMADYYETAGDYAQAARMFTKAAEMGMEASAPRAERARGKLKGQAPAERYTQAGKEVATIQSLLQAYNAADWSAIKKLYRADAQVHHNTTTPVGPADLVASLKQTVDALHSYEMTANPDAYERIVTDKGETWVNAWFRWQGQVTADGDPVVVPVHVTFRMVDGKIAEEHAYYNMAPLQAAFAAAAPARVHYVEMWNAKPAWEALSEADRNAYMAQVGAAIESLLAQGVQVVSFVMNDAATERRMDYDIFAIWSFPNTKMAREFEELVAASGWHEYFEQYNMSGTAMPPDKAMQEMVKM